MNDKVRCPRVERAYYANQLLPDHPAYTTSLPTGHTLESLYSNPVHQLLLLMRSTKAAWIVPGMKFTYTARTPMAMYAIALILVLDHKVECAAQYSLSALSLPCRLEQPQRADVRIHLKHIQESRVALAPDTVLS